MPMIAKISIIRLFQLREDVLLREIHDMRMALLKKICPNCNNAAATTNVTATNDEQVSLYNNIITYDLTVLTTSSIYIYIYLLFILIDFAIFCYFALHFLFV